ncbi:hypothetical protein ACIQUQ_10590 [Streptomyces sp. NPDC101118]|uniref:hypothetical protein n=1 Tax=Streptomyces sp. NPDC101118 TaxID=3366109 RepID=UPI00380C42F9
MRKALALLAIPALFMTLTACSGEGRSEEETAKAYIAALNDRDPDALVALARPTAGIVGQEADAAAIIAKDGGRGLKVTDVKVSHPFGPEVADVDVAGTDSAGKPFKIRVSVSREGDAADWTIGLGHPEKTDKTPAATSS